MSSAYYRRQLVEIQETPAPDHLVFGWARAGRIAITSGEHKRGLLLMSGSDGFIPATKEGLAGAEEACILAESMNIPEGEKAETYGYFGGLFNGKDIKLAYETEEDTHEELLEAVRETLRKKGIDITYRTSEVL